MCFSADMSLGLGVIGIAASSVTFLDKTESFWVRVARSYAIFHFSLMEFIQYFAYPVADQCGYGPNLFLSELSTYHISMQALAIMPALATYSSDKSALKHATLFGATLSCLFLVCSFCQKICKFLILHLILLAIWFPVCLWELIISAITSRVHLEPLLLTGRYLRWH